MPKDTFFNLNEEKRMRIDQVLIDEFSTKPYKDVNIKTIVDRLGIARGSFYQYFDDLEDSYFYILDKETKDMHLLFMNILKENKGDVFSSLEKYGQKAVQLIFDEGRYNIYKFRYLYWNHDLEKDWEKSRGHHYSIFEIGDKDNNLELVNFLKAIVHSLIERNFREFWTKEEFLEKYKIHINWIKKGVDNENI